MAGQPIRADWTPSAAHLLLLSKFRYGGLDTHYIDAQHWESVLGEKTAKAIDKFLEQRLLVRAGLNELLDFQFKTTDLKRMLKERQLKVSGRKSELIERLIVNDKDRMAEMTKNIRLLNLNPA